jgi:rod shape-determining protein MreC
LLELRGVPYRDTIPAGTLVLTSGLGGVYPKGIPVGRVLGVVRELTGWERTYLVLPAANPAHAAHALVLLGSAELSLEGAFPDEAP